MTNISLARVHGLLGRKNLKLRRYTHNGNLIFVPNTREFVLKKLMNYYNCIQHTPKRILKKLVNGDET